MKFYDLEWLASKCGTDNKYEITVKVAAEARRESEEAIPVKDKDSPADERFISNVLLEIEEDKSPISVNYKAPEVTSVVFSSSPDDKSEIKADEPEEVTEEITEKEELQPSNE